MAIRSFLGARRAGARPGAPLVLPHGALRRQLRKRTQTTRTAVVERFAAGTRACLLVMLACALALARSLACLCLLVACLLACVSRCLLTCACWPKGFLVSCKFTYCLLVFLRACPPYSMRALATSKQASTQERAKQQATQLTRACWLFFLFPRRASHNWKCAMPA